jgi:DNA-binding transcriptional LysR family regulator
MHYQALEHLRLGRREEGLERLRAAFAYSPFLRTAEEIERLTGERLERWVRLRDNQLISELVREGAGLALLPRFTTTVGRGLVLRPLVELRSARTISALCRRDRYARLAVRKVVDELAAIGSALSPPARA